MRVLDFYQKEREWGMGSIAERLYQILVENREQRLADYPMLQQIGQLEDWDILVYNGKSFPSTIDGLKAVMAAKYGEKQILTHKFNHNVGIEVLHVHIVGDYSGAKSMLPCIEIGGDIWAVMPEDYRLYTVKNGDNIALTGGVKKHGELISGEKEIAIPYSQKTFSAGGGRVEAWETGYFFVPIGKPIELLKAVK